MDSSIADGQNPSGDGKVSDDVLLRAEHLFGEFRSTHYRSTDQIFQFLLVFQWFAAIIIANVVSPKTWLGATESVHSHVWMSIIIGGVLTVVPFLMVKYQTGTAPTRHVIAISQMCWSAFLIHLTGGRIETHFHIFGSLAFLAFYRDWKVIVTATVVVAADHAFRGIWWPQSVFGVITASPFRWIEHACWVVFEDIFLFITMFKGNNLSHRLCQTQAEIESSHRKEMELLNRAMSAASCGVAISDARQPELPLIYVNGGYEKITRYQRDEVIGNSFMFLEEGELEQEGVAAIRAAIKNQESCQVLLRSCRKDGSKFWNELEMSPVHNEQGELTHYLGIQTDVTERENSKTAQEKNRAELAAANKELAHQIAEKEVAEKEKDRLNKELLTASRQAGMAEVATGVLHNVGNVMNSINASAEVLADGLKESRLSKISQIVDLMNSPNEKIASLLLQDAKGKKVPVYLEKLATHLEKERQRAITETESLRVNINHVAEIVSMQQTYARLGGLAEEFCLNELCQDSIKINDAGLIRHGVDLELEFAELEPINNEKHKILQILVNFVSNAKYAVSASRNPDKKMSMKTLVDPDGNFVVEVADNGVGISLEDQEQVFRHGFTTKADGHGFGLHSSILAAREIGGDISFESEGEGCGAVFRLTLPRNKVAAKGSVAIPYFDSESTDFDASVSAAEN